MYINWKGTKEKKYMQRENAEGWANDNSVLVLETNLKLLQKPHACACIITYSNMTLTFSPLSV